MKTLDEVIDNFEKACDLERRCENCSGCLGQENGCPYDGAESVPDALHYLKRYREENKELGRAINRACDAESEYNRLIEDLECNDPLTWDELKAMEGKPVWVEYLRDGATYDAEWCIVKNINDDFLHDTEGYGYGRADKYGDGYGVGWQAYRKERK